MPGANGRWIRSRGSGGRAAHVGGDCGKGESDRLLIAIEGNLDSAAGHGAHDARDRSCFGMVKLDRAAERRTRIGFKESAGRGYVAQCSRYRQVRDQLFAKIKRRFGLEGGPSV